MQTYLFTPTTTMKRYNAKSYWISGDIIPPVRAREENLAAALNVFRTKAKECGVDISDHSLKRKEPMYYDGLAAVPVQCGWVITGSTTIYGDDGNPTTQYVDIWVKVEVVTLPFDFD